MQQYKAGEQIPGNTSRPWRDATVDGIFATVRQPRHHGAYPNDIVQPQPASRFNRFDKQRSASAADPENSAPWAKHQGQDAQRKASVAAERNNDNNAESEAGSITRNPKKPLQHLKTTDRTQDV